MNSWLRSIPLLYLVFLLSLLHLGYFLLYRKTESIVFFVMISTFVYLLYPNMIVVLSSTMILTDLLYALKREGFRREGFDGSMIPIQREGFDGSMNEMDGSMNRMYPSIEEDGSMNTLKNPFVSSEAAPPTRYLESFVKGMFQKETIPGNDLAELESDSSLLDQKIQYTKETSPELSDASKINVAEFNTLMTRLNTMLGTVSE